MMTPVIPALPKEHFQEEVLQCFSIPVPISLALRHGWLLKETRKGKWNRRYFVLFRHTLVWYKNDSPDMLAQGALTLCESTVIRNSVHGHDCLEVTTPLALLMRTAKETSRGRVFRFRAAERSELDNWQHALIQQNTKSAGVEKWPSEFVGDKWVI